MKRRVVSVVVGLTLLLGFTIGVGAAPVLEKITAHLNWSVKFSLDGKTWAPKDEKGNKLAPITYKNTTYLPVRAVSEAVGTAVQWDAKTQTINLGEQTSTFPIGKGEIKKGAFAFPTIDKQYTVQNGKDYQSGIILENLNSASKSFSLVPNGQYQKMNLTVISIDPKVEVRVKVTNGDTVLKDFLLTPGQSMDSIELNIGGMKEISFTGRTEAGYNEKVFITGYYK